ncbi:MAG: hypothetical protein U9Q82_04065 [Chloroflexota bacterium]|nr:hypothetical protein [Chloroflexota bacterium]
MSQKTNKHALIATYEGQHNAIVSDQLFLRNQERRKARRSNPGNSKRKRRVYPLKGVGKCWECLECLGEIVGLRGSTGGRNSYPLYRCGAKQDRGMSRKRASKTTVQVALDNADLEINQRIDIADWSARHHTLKETKIMAEVEKLLFRFDIPDEWFRPILAYTKFPDGMLHIEAQIRELRKRQSHVEKFYRAGKIDLATLQSDRARLQAKINALWHTSLGDTQELETLLVDFSEIWELLKPFEKNNLLNLIFEGLFFDGQGRLRWILAHSPFDRLLGLPEGGLMLEA